MVEILVGLVVAALLHLFEKTRRLERQVSEHQKHQKLLTTALEVFAKDSTEAPLDEKEALHRIFVLGLFARDLSRWEKVSPFWTERFTRYLIERNTPPDGYWDIAAEVKRRQRGG